MTEEELYRSLDYVNHSREKRAEISALILENPHLIAPLMEIAFTVDDPISNRDCWVFDWLIGNHKVAAQAYSMTCLLLLGEKFDWIHPELKMILEQNYAVGSAAYKARARMTLAKLK